MYICIFKPKPNTHERLLFDNIFVINVYHITAQNIQVWPEKFEEVTYFDVIDMTLKSGQFYKESQISVKAGEGAFFLQLRVHFSSNIYNGYFDAKMDHGFVRRIRAGTFYV